MLRDDKRKMPMPTPMPMPKPMPRREPVYDDFDYPRYEYPDCKPRREHPEYDCPEFEYPMIPMYPNNMNPCPYPREDVYEERCISVDELMRKNTMLKKCIMECVDKYVDSFNPCNHCRPKPMPMPRPIMRPRRKPCTYGMEEYGYESYDTLVGESENYEFSETEVEDFIEESEIETKEEK